MSRRSLRLLSGQTLLQSAAEFPATYRFHVPAGVSVLLPGSPAAVPGYFRRITARILPLVDAPGGDGPP